MYTDLALARREEDLGMVGVMPAPPGLRANFVDPPWNGKSLEILGIVCLIVSTIFVVMRLYTRFVILRKVGLDDCTFLVP